ncbi:MAG TPA: Fe-S cluster assembly protein SufD [Chloroflexota bacterium]
MTAVAKATDQYVAAFRELESSGRAGPSWLQQLRREALERFTERGFPTRKDEEWKYTDVSSIARGSFGLSAVGAPPVGAQGGHRSRPYEVGERIGLLSSVQSLEGVRLVFVDGVWDQRLSSAAKAGEVRRLADAIADDPRLADDLGRWADVQRNPFAALNTAFVADGALVRVPRRSAGPALIHLVFVSEPGQERAMIQPRTLIILEAGAEATVVETYVGEGEVEYLTNAVTEIVLQEGASLDHYKLMLEGMSAAHVATTQVHQERDSSFRSFSLALGARLARNDLNVVLDAEGASCHLEGIAVAAGRQHIDNHTSIDHAKPHGTSRQTYKTLLGGNSTGVFSGKILVRPGAQRTDAEQVNRNLLLSQRATMDTKPQLEIFADDVRCTHGATVGRLDTGALFYLQSRGLERREASALLTYGFAADVIERQRSEPVRALIESLLFPWVQESFQSGEME